MTTINTILSAEMISPGIKKFLIYQPDISRARKPGQFVMVRLNDQGERVPLTIVDSDTVKKTITLIVQEAGKSTRMMNQLNEGDVIQDIAGPLGTPSEIEKYGTVLIIGGGVGTAVAYPVAKAMQEAGNTVSAILGVRNEQALILTAELQETCSEVYISTDDGSAGFHGNTSQLLKKLLEESHHYDLIFASGPLLMMKSISDLTRLLNIPTRVSLNTLMVDGTGMCGGCRVTIGDKSLFTCVDGPEFDSHLVDFDTLIKRNHSYDHVEITNNASVRSVKKVVTASPKTIRQKMPAQEPKIRILNFDEVNLGYCKETARLEAARCLQCKKPACVDGCPVGVQIPKFIQKLSEGDYLAAAAIYKHDNALAAVCARVCPQADQCEGQCVLTRKGEAVAIGNLARFVLDYAHDHENQVKPIKDADTGQQVAIIGSGPAGLTCAKDLAMLGHQVTVFEALHELGGVLTYGIPEFRLPKRIVHEETEALEELGVIFKKNVLIGNTITIDNLFTRGFEAVFISVGAGLPYFMNIAGENLVGVYSANEFLIRVNMMKANLFPAYDTPILNLRSKRVAVIGGGNTALDSARVAMRMGASQVDVLYRRTEADMPARIEEYAHAREEGIQFHFLCAPREFVGNSEGQLTGVQVQRMKQGEADASGRRSPLPIEGSDYLIEIQAAIIAIGNGSNPIIQKTTPDLKFNQWGNILVDEESMATNRMRIFSGGDIVTGGATVISAMGAGRKAARAIDQYLRNR